MTGNEFKYWAFLSYSAQDTCGQPVGGQSWSDWLRNAFETFSIPAEFAGQINTRGEIIPERLSPLYLDDQEQPAESVLGEAVRTALEQSKCLVVICSPRSAKSLHVNEAVRYFKQLGRGNRILPIVVAGEPYASDGNKPGISADDECFVPALQHPVTPDGTLDTTRRDGKPIFADARIGDGQQATLAEDRLRAETKLEIAKIQLIAGLAGVGFNGLWGREQQRRFAETHNQAREVHIQIQEAQRQAQEAERQLQEARHQAQEAERQLQEARHQAQEAERQLQEARQQAEEAQRLAQEAQAQAQAARTQADAVPDQVREAQNQAEQARHQALEAERQLQEARQQAEEAQRLAQEAQAQAQAARTQADAVPDQVREAQNQAEQARHQAQEAERQLQEARQQAEEAQRLAQEAQAQAQAARTQADAVPDQVRETQNQVEQARRQAQEAERQLQEARQQAEETRHLAQEAQAQAQATRTQADAVPDQVREAQNQVEQARRQAQEAERQLQEARQQAEEARRQAQEAQAQAQEARTQADAVPNQVRDAQVQVQMARRKTRFFALMAVLALLAAGIAAGVAYWQRKGARQSAAKSDFEETKESDIAPGGMDLAWIQQALQRIAGTWQYTNRLQKLDELAVRIPVAEIPEALKSSSVILDDKQRCSFQKKLLVRLGAANPLSAMACANTIQGVIVNDDALSDSGVFFQLAVLENWVKTDLPGARGWVCQLSDVDSRRRALEKIIPALAADNPTNALAVLNGLKPLPGAENYTQLFQCWATNDPVQAIQQLPQVANPAYRDNLLCAIIAAWVDLQPDAAWAWVKSQPDSESKDRAMETCVEETAKSNFPQALTEAESFAAGTWRDAVIAGLFDHWAARDLDAATAACQQLPEGPAKTKAWECVLYQRLAKDPASAAELVTNLPPGDYRQNALATLCHSWANTNAPAALAWAQALPSEAERVAALNNIVADWAANDPQAALQFADQHPELSGAALGEIAKAWSKTDLTAASHWVESLPEGQKKDAALLALAEATEARAPQTAAELCAALTTTQPSTMDVEAIARSMAKDDFARALEWARSRKDDPTRLAALSALAYTWAQRDPQGLAAYALGLPAGDAQTQCLSAACHQLAMSDLPAAMELLKPLADGELRQDLLAQTARGCDQPHLESAAQYIAAMPAGEDQKAAIMGLLENWTDPARAATWLASFPETNSQSKPLQFVIKSWAQSEPAAAAQWLTNSPAGTAGTAVVSAFLDGAVSKYPEFAGQWTQSVADATERQKYQLQVARQWMATDPAAASNWLNHLDLPEEVKGPLKAQSPP